MRVLGIDVGTSRTGVAISDPLGVTCAPLPVIRERDGEKALLRVVAIADEYSAGEIVVGLPRPLGGGTNEQMAAVVAFKERLATLTAIPVVAWDERYHLETCREWREEDGRAGFGRCVLHAAGLSRLAVQELTGEKDERLVFRTTRAGESYPVKKKKRRSARAWITRIVVVVGFFAFLYGVYTAVNRGHEWLQARAAETTTTTLAASVRVTISPGMTVTQIGQLLEDKGVIASATGFVDLVDSRGSETKLQPGTYQLPTKSQLITIVDKLEKGRVPPRSKSPSPRASPQAR